MGLKKHTILWLTILLFIGCSTTHPTLAGIRTVTSQGKVYTPFTHIAPYYNMQPSTSGKTIRLKSKWHTLEFETDSRRCWINGTLVWLCHPVRKAGSQWAIENPEFAKTVDPMVRPYAYLSKVGSKTVVIDPGHGGKDKGATSPRNVYEKLAVFDISKRIRTHLQKKGVRVHFTRNGDTAISLSDRCKKAKKLKADLFVSIHADIAANRSVKGTSAFILAPAGTYSTHSYGSGTPSKTPNPGNKFDLANAALGLRIQQHLLKSTGQTDRGVKRARFSVLRDAPCPATLVEVAFLSNAQEEAMIIDKNGREKIARGISNGILAYLNDVKRSKK